MLTIAVRCLPLLCLGLLGSQEPVVFTPELVAGLRSVASIESSPSGAQVAYTLSVPRKAGVDEDGPAWSELHVIDVAGGRTRAFVSGEVSVRSLSWTADGMEIGFLSKRSGDDETGLYLIPVDGGEARRALVLEGGIQSYSLAPDGKRVACIVAPAKDKAREKQRKQGFAQEIYEEEERPSELWLASLDDISTARRLAFDGHPSLVLWSPVDDRLLVTWTPTTLVDDEYMQKRVAILDGEQGKVVARIENPGKLGKVAWSPDGEQIALIAAGDLNDPSAGRVCTAPASGGVPKDLLPGFEGDVLDFAWQSPQAMWLVTHVGLWSRFEQLNLSADGASARTFVEAGGPILTGLSLSEDGLSAALLASAPQHPAEVFHLGQGESAPRRLTRSNPQLDGVRFARQEALRYRAREGLELEGVLIQPLERDGDARVPLLLAVHGGPEAHVSNGWNTSYSLPGQVAAARGFAVFQPNYRGSTGRGVAFSKLSQGDAAGKEFDDLVDAVDHLIEIGLVDGSRVGVTGGSYGGYATAWCSTRFSEHFAAGVMFVGISDKISKVGTTDIPNEEYHVHALKRPWEDWQYQLERSPIYYADQSKTPLLILHGKDDPRVNPGQSRELYRHLKLRGQAPVRLVLYPGEGHGNRKAAARLDYALRSLRWFEHYLMGPGGEMPSPKIEYGVGEAVDG